MTTETPAIPSTDILGVQINALTMPLAIDTIERWIDTRLKQYICICTVHSIMEAQRDTTYREVLNGAGLRTPDGMPLVWLSRRDGKAKVERVCGPDLLPELIRRSGATGHRHFFYGGGPGVADDLARSLAERFPDMQVAGTWEPPMQTVGAIEDAEVVRRINRSGADIVWVGLGSPKQDVWIANHRAVLEPPILIGVGAAFDFHAVRVKRAPVWMQRSGLEWLFRLSQDPRRLWKRYLIGNARFVALLVTRRQSSRDTKHSPI